MTEDIATEFGLLPPISGETILSPGEMVALLLEIQSSLLETPEYAHLSDPAEDLLLGLVRSMKNAEALSRAGVATVGKPVDPGPGDAGRPRLRVVTNA